MILKLDNGFIINLPSAIVPLLDVGIVGCEF